MIPLHQSYKAEILEERFERKGGPGTPGSALLHFQVQETDEPVLLRMGYLEEEEIYRMIDRDEPVVLDHCFVDRFSLGEYRRRRNLDPRAKVTLHGFSARFAFFGCLRPLDLSYGVFEGEQCTLEDTLVGRGEVTFEGSRFRCGMLNFHNTRWPSGPFNFKNVVVEKASVTFRNCRFGKGDKNFQYAALGEGNVSFQNVEFSAGNVSFINTDFGSGDVSFKVARFGTGKVDFHFATFKEGHVGFEHTEFGNGKVDFRTVEFGTGKVNFNHSRFGHGEKVFDESEMESGKFSFKRANLGTGRVSFEQVMFEHVETSFERTSFGSELSFYHSWFRSLSLGFCHLDGFVDLRVRSCPHMDLSNSIVRDIVDMDPVGFPSRVETLTMEGMRLIGRIHIDWNRNHVRELIYSQQGSGHQLKAEQFRVLKENFKNLGLYDDEDRAYVEYKRNESKAILADHLSRNRLNGIFHYPLYWFKLLLFDRAGLYATSPLRVLFTMLTVFTLFSVIYFLLMIFTRADIVSSVSDNLPMLSRSFYHSAVTFLTIGYGDHYPYGSIRWVSAVEGFLGLFFMSYFTVAFVRKVLR